MESRVKIIEYNGFLLSVAISVFRYNQKLDIGCAGDENQAYTDNIANDSFCQVWPSTLPISCKTNPGPEQRI